jgi:hypothetical protein
LAGFVLRGSITGSIIVGHGPKDGTSSGRGLEDFVSMTWDGEKHDAKPTVEAPFDKADGRFLLETDFSGSKRTGPVSGAVQR